MGRSWLSGVRFDLFRYWILAVWAMPRAVGVGRSLLMDSGLTELPILFWGSLL